MMPDFPSAVCAQTDPDAWHPEDRSSSQAAVRACRACPHITECLDWAMTLQPDHHGVLGGATALQRRRMRGPRPGGRPQAPIPNSVAHRWRVGDNPAVIASLTGHDMVDVTRWVEQLRAVPA